MGSAFQRRVRLGIMVGSREFFSPTVALASREQVLAQLARLDVDPLILPVDATANGAVQSREDAKLYARFFREHREEIDGLVVLLPNFGDEIAILETLQACRPQGPAPPPGKQRRNRQGRRQTPARCLLRQDLGHQQPLPVRHPLHRHRDAHLRRRRRCLSRRPRPVRPDLPRGAGPGQGPYRRDRRPYRRIPDHALLGEAAPGGRRHGGHRRPLGDHRRRHRDHRRRCDREGQARRDLRLWQDSRPHRPRQHRQAGEMEPRRRPLDRRERMRCELDPVLELAAEQFRLRHLPHHVDHGREADALGLRGRRDGRRLDVRVGPRLRRAARDPRLEQQLRQPAGHVRLHALRQFPEEFHRRHAGDFQSRRPRHGARHRNAASAPSRARSRPGR